MSSSAVILKSGRPAGAGRAGEEEAGRCEGRRADSRRSLVEHWLADIGTVLDGLEMVFK